MLAREFLLELAHEARLDFVHHLQKLEGHKDDNGLAARHIHLLRGDNVQLAKLSLEVAAVRLEVAQSLRDVELEGLGLGALLLHDLLGCEHGGPTSTTGTRERLTLSRATFRPFIPIHRGHEEDFLLWGRKSGCGAMFTPDENGP